MDHLKIFHYLLGTLVLSTFLVETGLSQKPYRVGTTSANFLEIGYGSAGSAMGDAYASVVTDLSAIYWNPAGLAFMPQSQALFEYQPWVANINTLFTGVGWVSPSIGTLAVGLFQSDYGAMEVTTLEQQDGTGELFTPRDYCFALSYARQLAQWFAFGASGKYVTSQIWHLNAHALALDLGVVVTTRFFSTTGERSDGMKIGMSIANYGTRMKYDGIDLINPIDILPDEAGNYRDAPGQFRLNQWELPLIFRLGFAVDPYVQTNHRLTLAVDALHPNNNSESVNVGAQYQLRLPGVGEFYLRSGYKGLFMLNSQFGLSFGGGVQLRLLNNVGIKLDYAFRSTAILGNTHAYSIGLLF
ncbi:PorV/PorQ family protein [candidate division KSB1 bacterium]|nr:PorV/PorQ family protein [candidate division KSB1 bacterium]